MADYEIYVDDDRYKVPSLYLITANSEARARAIADELWRSSPHHQGVELRRDGRHLAGLGSLADELPPPGARTSPATKTSAGPC